MNTYLRDMEEIKIDTMSELMEFLRSREESDRWLKIPLARTKVIGVPNAPIIASTIVEDIEGYKGTEEDLSQVMTETGLLISFYNEEDQLETYPLRYTGNESILGRAGLTGRTMRETGERALSPEKKAEWLSEAIQLYKSTNCNLLVRDSKVGAVCSERYLPLSTSRLVDSLYSAIQQWDNVSLSGSTISHEYTEVSFTYGSEAICSDILEKLNDLGFNCYKIELSLRFYTSDTGDSAATVIPYCEIDGLPIAVGNSLKMVHSKGASFEKWEDMILPRIMSFPRETTETLNQLGTIKIKNPGGCLRYIACELGLSKLSSLKIASELDELYNTCTALDIYYYLYEIVKSIGGNKPRSLAQEIREQETLSRVLNMDIKSCDVLFEWK